MWLRETPNAHAGNYLICVPPHENGRSCREHNADDGAKSAQNLHTTTIAARLRWCESSGGCAGCAWCFPVCPHCTSARGCRKGSGPLAAPLAPLGTRGLQGPNCGIAALREYIPLAAHRPRRVRETRPTVKKVLGGWRLPAQDRRKVRKAGGFHAGARRVHRRNGLHGLLAGSSHARCATSNECASQQPCH